MDNVDKLSTKDIRDYTGLELAFIGDAIWELEIRKYYLPPKWKCSLGS